jgi:inorganic pyrophosphatase
VWHREKTFGGRKTNKRRQHTNIIVSSWRSTAKRQWFRSATGLTHRFGNHAHPRVRACACWLGKVSLSSLPCRERGKNRKHENKDREGVTVGDVPPVKANMNDIEARTSHLQRKPGLTSASRRRRAADAPAVNAAGSFWTYLDMLLQSAELVIDRPRGSSHPRYPSLVYPLDYGYLKGTSGGDGNELDVWRGTSTEAKLDAVVCTVDLLKRDVEVKLLVGCTEEEKTTICDFHNDGEYMAATLLKRRVR